MSFSSDLKEELSKINNLTKKEELKYELSGYLISKNASIIKNNIRYATESEYNINRFSKLLKNLDINHNIEFDGKSFIITLKTKDTINEVDIQKRFAVKYAKSFNSAYLFFSKKKYTSLWYVSFFYVNNKFEVLIDGV